MANEAHPVLCSLDFWRFLLVDLRVNADCTVLPQIELNNALSVLADRFGTSIMHIQINNWDLTSITAAGLLVGKEMCVIPSSCDG